MKVSVVVPTYARPERLRRLLCALREQRFPTEEFEVIVVDDGSPVDSRPEPHWFTGNQRLLNQAQQGPAAARNRGVDEACGSLVAFTDDDCLPDPGWLDALWRAYRQTPEALLGGHTVNGLPENWYSATAESLLQFFDEDQLAQGKSVNLLASNNLACDRNRFLSLGGFDRSYALAAGEDRALCRRWAQTGSPLHRVPNARVAHFHDHTLQSFWRQQRNYGMGAAVYHQQAANDSIVPEAPSFYLRLLFHPLRRDGWSRLKRVSVVAIVVLSQVAIAVGMFKQRRADRASNQ